MRKINVLISDDPLSKAKRFEGEQESPTIIGQKLRKDRSRPHLDKLPFKNYTS